MAIGAFLACDHKAERYAADHTESDREGDRIGRLIGRQEDLFKGHGFLWNDYDFDALAESVFQVSFVCQDNLNFQTLFIDKLCQRHRTCVDDSSRIFIESEELFQGVCRDNSD